MVQVAPQATAGTVKSAISRVPGLGHGEAPFQIVIRNFAFTTRIRHVVHVPTLRHAGLYSVSVSAHPLLPLPPQVAHGTSLTSGRGMNVWAKT